MPNPKTGMNCVQLTRNREQIRASLTQKFRLHFQEPSKVVARKIGKSAEAVGLYREQSVPQAWASFAETCQANPHFALDILSDLGIELDDDRHGYAQFLSMKRAQERR